MGWPQLKYPIRAGVRGVAKADIWLSPDSQPRDWRKLWFWNAKSSEVSLSWDSSLIALISLPSMKSIGALASSEENIGPYSYAC